MILLPVALGAACILLAMALDGWDAARWWPMLAFLAAGWAWAGYWQWRGRARRG